MNSTMEVSTTAETGSGLTFFVDFVIGLQILVSALTVLVNFATGFSYMLTWKMHSLAGRAFAHILISRSLHLTIYGVMDFGLGSHWNEKAPAACVVLGFLHHFIWMSEYAWLVTVNFDLWRSFRDFTPRRSSESKTRQYLRYSIFAWSTPLLIVSLSVIVYFATLKQYGSSTKFVPDFGSCSVSRSAVLIYVIPTTATFILVALTFGILTYNALRRHRDDTASVRLAKHNKQDISNFRLFWKLSILMGINWKIEFIIGVCLYVGLDYYDWDDPDIPPSTHLAFASGALALLIYMFLSATTISVLFVFKNKVVSEQLRQVLTRRADTLSRIFVRQERDVRPILSETSESCPMNVQRSEPNMSEKETDEETGT